MSRSGWWALGLFFMPFLIGGCTGEHVVTESQFRLLTGWILYLGRTLPRVQVDPAAVATGVGCLIAFSVGGHWFLSWLYAASGPRKTPDQTYAPRIWRIRWTAYVVTLTVVAFAAGISAVGMMHQTTWIVTGPDPQAPVRGK